MWLDWYPLNDDIAGTADNSQTLALDDTAGTFTNECLVRGDGNTENTGIVTVLYKQAVPFHPSFRETYYFTETDGAFGS